MTINISLAYTLAFLFVFVLPSIFVFMLKNKPKILKPVVVTLFVIYLILLFIGTAGKISLKGNTLSISLDFSHGWFSSYFSWFQFSKRNIIINLFMFFPIGFVVYSLSNKHPFLKTILLSFLISITIELYQWVLPIVRNTEVSDILFNFASGIISALYCEVLKKLGAFLPKKT